MAKLLVTGGAGFIGSHFVRHWLRENPGDAVVVVDALTYAGTLRNLEGLDSRPRFRFVRGDINDLPLIQGLLSEHGIDTLVHFAAESHVDRSIADPDVFIRTNVAGTHVLLRAARNVWLAPERVVAHRFHHVSTDEVYGSRAEEDPPAHEGSAYAPNSPYAASKAASDHLVRAYARTYGLRVTTSSSSNNYGPRQYPEKLVPLTLVHLLEGRSVPIYGDGRNLRDWLHVEDHCRGLARVLEQGSPGEVYHLGGGTTLANLDLVRLLCAIVDERFRRDATLARRFPAAAAARGLRSESLIENVADRPGHDRRYAVSGEKARRELGFTAAIALEQGLADTLDWYLANEDWWRGRR